MTVCYATLDECKAELKATSTNDDTKLLGYIRQVSRRIDGFFKVKRPLFAPLLETRAFILYNDQIQGSRILNLNTPLLSLSSVVLNGSSVTVGTGVTVYPSTTAPFYKLWLKDASLSWFDNLQNSVEPSALVTGVWGYNRDFNNAYVQVDTITADINDSVTSLTVNDADGADEYGLTPRLSIGNVIQLGTELMDVIGVNTSTNVLTVRRGVLGTTASTHLTGTAVKVYQVDDSIKRAVSRQVAFQYARRGAFESATITDLGNVQFPADVLAELRGIISEMAYT